MIDAIDILQEHRSTFNVRLTDTNRPGEHRRVDNYPVSGAGFSIYVPIFFNKLRLLSKLARYELSGDGGI